MEHVLNKRARRILEAVIRGYIETGGPVGSSTVVNRYRIPFSSATVRNEMSALKKMGFIGQTHVSSGRVPTRQGIRYYLDNIVSIEELSKEKKARVRSMYPAGKEDYKGVARASSRVLAALTQYTGVVWAPGIQAMPVKHVEFVPLSEHRIMAVLISTGGLFQTTVFDWSEKLSGKDLVRASDYINDRFEGKTLVEIKEEILEEMRREKAEYDKLLERAIKLMDNALLPPGDMDEIFIDGRANLVEEPEFANANEMKAIFKVFGQKGMVVKLLGKALGEEDVQVLLSAEENVADIPGFALIMAHYGDIGDVGGALGVVGPVRMDYRNVIPLVKYTAHYVSSLLTV